MSTLTLGGSIANVNVFQPELRGIGGKKETNFGQRKLRMTPTMDDLWFNDRRINHIQATET